MPTLDLLLKARYIVDPNTFEVREGACIGVMNNLTTPVMAGDINFDAERTLDYGDAVIMPAFVNAHAHLDLSHLRGMLPPSDDFAHWLSCVMQARSAPIDLIVGAAQGAIGDMTRTGTASVMDVLASTPSALPVAREVLRSPLQAVIAVEAIGFNKSEGMASLGAAGRVFHEVLSELFEIRDEDLACYVDRVLDGRRTPIVGLSPHATYSTSHQTYAACSDHALRFHAPQTTHVAESPAEREFLATGRGPIRELYEKVGIDASAYVAPGVGPVDYWFAHAGCRHEASKTDTVLAHCYDAQDEEIERLGRHKVSIAWCPRSRAFFDHPSFKLDAMLKAGVNVCMGTDSLASNPSLDMLEELAEAHAQAPDAKLATLFKIATMNGRMALEGPAHRLARKPANFADLHVRAAPFGVKSRDALLAAMLEQQPAPLATIINGVLAFQHV